MNETIEMDLSDGRLREIERISKFFARKLGERFQKDIRQEILKEYYEKQGRTSDADVWGRLKHHIGYHAADRVIRTFRLGREFLSDNPTGEETSRDEVEYASSQSYRVRLAEFHPLTEAGEAELAEMARESLSVAAEQMKGVLSERQYYDLVTVTTKRLLANRQLDENELEGITITTGVKKEDIMKTDINSAGARKSCFRAQTVVRRLLKSKLLMALILLLFGMAVQAAAHVCH